MIFFICFIYIAPKTAKNDDKTPFDSLALDIEQYKVQGNIIVCGDMNAKTKLKNDFVEDTNDQHSPIISNPIYTKGIPLTRINKDLYPLDEWGRALLELCQSSNLKIINGYITEQIKFTTKLK